jgi:hypothetical protein
MFRLEPGKSCQHIKRFSAKKKGNILAKSHTLMVYTRMRGDAFQKENPVKEREKKGM